MGDEKTANTRGIMTPEEAEEYWARVAEEETQRVRADVQAVFDGNRPQMAVTGDDLRALLRIRDRAIARMADTACRGDRANLGACTADVERACGKREHNSCPQRVISMEEHLARLQPAALSPAEELLKGMGVPFKVACLVVGSLFEQRPVVGEVDRWWRGRKQVLALLGGNQIGKSSAAASLVWRHSGRFTTAREVAMRRREVTYLDGLRRSKLLVVDDLGFEPLDDRDEAFAAVSGLICDAVEEGQRVILTANLKATDLRPRYGDRLAERIKRHGYTPEFGED